MAHSAGVRGNPARDKTPKMNTSQTSLTTRQTQIVAKLRRSRCGIELVSHVWTTPAGSWPQTRQAENQAIDALPSGVGLGEAMDAVKAAGLVAHQHPDRSSAS